MWFLNSEQRQQQRLLFVLQQLGLRVQVAKGGYFQLLAKLDADLELTAELRCGFVRLTGYPELGFPPRKFPNSLLAQLLVRNAEIVAGAWQLGTNKDLIWCNFGMSIPLSNFRVRTAKHALELILAETHFIAVRFRHLATV